MTITTALNYINKSIKSTFAGAVNVLTKNTYRVYLPDIQKIEGEVDVKFPNTQKIEGKVDVKFPEVQKISGNVTTDTKSYFESLINKVVEMKNLFNDKGISIRNFPVIPTKIEIINFPKEKEIELSSLEKRLDVLNELIRKLPIKFPEFPKLPDYPAQKPIIFPENFGINNLEVLKSDSPKDYVPVRLTDGEEFYRALDTFVQQASTSMVFTDSQGRKKEALVDSSRHLQVDVNNGNMLTSYETNNVEKVNSGLIYNGVEDKDGNWCIQKVSINGRNTTVSFATVVNNPSKTSYPSAWTHRASITYGYFSDAF